MLFPNLDDQFVANFKAYWQSLPKTNDTKNNVLKILRCKLVKYLIGREYSTIDLFKIANHINIKNKD